MTEAERQQVIDALEAVNTERICDDVHHAKRDQHQFGEPCPVVQRVAAALAIMRREREPVAWVIPGNDNASPRGFIDAMAWQEGEFSRPLYGD